MNDVPVGLLVAVAVLGTVLAAALSAAKARVSSIRSAMSSRSRAAFARCSG